MSKKERSNAAAQGKWLCSCVGLVLATAVTGIAYADNLAQVSEKLTDATEAVTVLSYVMTYMTATGYTVSSMTKFKRHVENSQQMPMSQPLLDVMIAAALFFFPTIAEEGGDYLFTDHHLPAVMQQRREAQHHPLPRLAMQSPYPPLLENKQFWNYNPPSHATKQKPEVVAEMSEPVNIMDLYHM